MNNEISKINYEAFENIFQTILKPKKNPQDQKALDDIFHSLNSTQAFIGHIFKKTLIKEQIRKIMLYLAPSIDEFGQNWNSYTDLQKAKLVQLMQETDNYLQSYVTYPCRDIDDCDQLTLQESNFNDYLERLAWIGKEAAKFKKELKDAIHLKNPQTSNVEFQLRDEATFAEMNVTSIPSEAVTPANAINVTSSYSVGSEVMFEIQTEKNSVFNNETSKNTSFLPQMTVTSDLSEAVTPANAINVTSSHSAVSEVMYETSTKKNSVFNNATLKNTTLFPQTITSSDQINLNATSSSLSNTSNIVLNEKNNIIHNNSSDLSDQTTQINKDTDKSVLNLPSDFYIIVLTAFFSGFFSLIIRKNLADPINTLFNKNKKIKKALNYILSGLVDAGLKASLKIAANYSRQENINYEEIFIELGSSWALFSLMGFFLESLQQLKLIKQSGKLITFLPALMAAGSYFMILLTQGPHRFGQAVTGFMSNCVGGAAAQGFFEIEKKITKKKYELPIVAYYQSKESQVDDVGTDEECQRKSFNSN